MNLPPLVSDIRNISSLFNRGMDLIWNEWFRDENLQNSFTINTGDSADDPAIYALRKRGKRKDYFTSCLPWPQKGNAVSISLGSTAPITGTLNVPRTPISFLTNYGNGNERQLSNSPLRGDTTSGSVGLFNAEVYGPNLTASAPTTSSDLPFTPLS